MAFPQDRYIVVRVAHKDVAPVRRLLHALANNENLKVADMVSGGNIATTPAEDKVIREAFKTIGDTFDKALERAKNGEKTSN